jgi:hypothetical protein
MEHPQGRAPRSLPYQGSPSLSTGWMPEMVEAEGLARALRARPCGLRLRRPGRAAALLHPHLRDDSHRRPQAMSPSTRFASSGHSTRAERRNGLP